MWQIGANHMVVVKIHRAKSSLSKLIAQAWFLLQESFESLPITSAQASSAGMLSGPHKDPFERMLIAQAQAENVPMVSNDTIFDEYKVRRLWS
jgi:PIN domain nuclease of toxin-antitoxin system